MNDTVCVLSLRPFWRYAVGPDNGRNPALPFYRYASAKAFAEEMRQLLPWEPAIIYRRIWWNNDVEVLEVLEARKEAK